MADLTNKVNRRVKRPEDVLKKHTYVLYDERADDKGNIGNASILSAFDEDDDDLAIASAAKKSAEVQVPGVLYRMGSKRILKGVHNYYSEHFVKRIG